MEFPWRCRVCGYENLVNLDNLSKRPIDKIVTAEGFACGKCGHWEAIFHSTPSLEEAMRKLMRLSPEKTGYRFHFLKTLKKAIGINERAESRWPEQASPPG
jgi:hypothetical protein